MNTILDFVYNHNGLIVLLWMLLTAVLLFRRLDAANRILQMTDTEKARGVLAASAGNHAQGVARAAAGLGIACTIVMPESAPPTRPA